MTVAVQVFKMPGENNYHCIDFSLKKYRVDDRPETDLPNCEVQTHFKQHFKNLINLEHVRNYIDLSSTEAGAF
jgi:hypothetical protein